METIEIVVNESSRKRIYIESMVIVGAIVVFTFFLHVTGQFGDLDEVVGNLTWGVPISLGIVGGLFRLWLGIRPGAISKVAMDGRVVEVAYRSQLQRRIEGKDILKVAIDLRSETMTLFLRGGDEVPITGFSLSEKQWASLCLAFEQCYPEVIEVRDGIADAMENLSMWLFRIAAVSLILGTIAGIALFLLIDANAMQWCLFVAVMMAFVTGGYGVRCRLMSRRNTNIRR